LQSANNSGTPTGATIHLAARNRMPPQGAVNAVTARLYLQDGGGVGAGGVVARTNSVNDTYATNMGLGATGVNVFDSDTSTDQDCFSFVHDRTQATVSLQNAAYMNGSALSSTTTGGSAATGSFTAAPWYLGAGVSGNLPSRLAAKTVLIYEVAQSSGTVASVAALIRPTPATGALDSYTSNLWGLYSLRLERSAYGGSAIRVRRSSDNTEQDIGFASGFLDAASMLTFCGANDGFVTKFYDQSGGGNDLVQATSGNQPQIVGVGVSYGWVRFDGTNDVLTTANNSGTPSAFTVFTRCLIRSMGDSALVEHSSNYNSNNATLIEPGATTNQIQVGLHGTGGGGGYVASRFSTNVVNQVSCFALDRAASGAAKARMFNGGKLLTRDANGDSGTAPTGNFAAAQWSVGARAAAAFGPAPLNLYTLAIYEAVISDANIERISRGLG